MQSQMKRTLDELFEHSSQDMNFWSLVFSDPRRQCADTMLSHGNGKTGRNDPCPCGPGKKYKRCCLQQQSASYSFWAQQRDAAPKRTNAQAKKDDEFEQGLLRDPVARSWLRQIIQKQVEDWVHLKVPALGGRTPLQAVRDPDGKEVVESCFWVGNAALTKVCTRPESAPISTSSAKC